MKNVIKKLLRESLLYEGMIFEDDIDMDSCDCCGYFNFDSLEVYGGLEKPLYFMLEKRQRFELKYVKPKQYLYSVARGFGVSYEDSMAHVQDEKVKKYAEDMKNGSKFPIGFYTNNEPSQEGRHRAAALMILGCEYMPIVVINSLTQNEVKHITIQYDGLSFEEVDQEFKELGYNGITVLDYNCLKNKIRFFKDS